MRGQENRLGALLVGDSIVTRTQLNHALQVQKEQEKRQRLGVILVDLGYVTRRKLRSVIRRYGKRTLFGELLVEEGTITREQLEQALEEHKTSGDALGTVMVRMGLLDEEGLAQALHRQLDIPYMIAQPNLVDMNLFGRLPERFAQLNSVIAVGEADGVVTVLVADPTDLNVIYRLEDTFGHNIELAICSKSRIDSCIDSLLRQKRFAAETKRAGLPEHGQVVLSDGVVIRSEETVHETDGALVARVLDYLICNAVEERASDVHIEPQRDRVQVRYRIDGVLQFRTEFPLSFAKPVVTRAKALANLDISTSARQQKGRILAHVNKREVDLRITIGASVFGESMAIRVFSKDSGLMDLDDLGMAPEVLAVYKRLAARSSGLTLFAGPTGAGKTTSLYATLNHLNDGSRKITTVECPVEFPMDGTVQKDLPAEEEVDITKALYETIDQDPDVIALGDVTGEESLQALLDLAMTGHKVFSTIHGEDCSSTLVRLGDVSGAAAFLSSCSLVVVSQRLVRKVCEGCSEIYVPPVGLVEECQVRDFNPDTVDFRSGSGCAECLQTGYRGRTGVFEMVVVSSEMRRALLGSPSAQEVMQMMLKSPSYIPLRQSGFLKAVQGVTTLEEVLRVAPTIEAELPEEEQSTLSELAQRAGLVLEGKVETANHDMAQTPPQT